MDKATVLERYGFDIRENPKLNSAVRTIFNFAVGSVDAGKNWLDNVELFFEETPFLPNIKFIQSL